MKTKRILYFFLLIFALAGCKKENLCDCFKSTGKIITEERILEPFNSIFVQDNINLFLTRDSLFSIKIEAGKNLLPLIKTEVKNQSLYIRNDNKCNWVRSYKPQINAYISMPSLLFIEQSGCGEIKTTNTFTGDSIRFDSKNGSGNIEASVDVKKCYVIVHTGPLDVKLKGKSDELQLFYNGLGQIRCEELSTHYTYITHKSTGNCYVNCNDLLIYHIKWTGNIYYTGNPLQIFGTITGSGNAIPF